MSQQSPNLDLLRSTAVLLVFICHAPYLFGLGGVLPVEFRIFGVMLFFVHTSIVLSASLSRLEQRNQHVIAGFFIRRAFRIYPLSMFTVLTVFLFHIPPWFKTPYRGPDAQYFWSNLLLYQSLARQWSVLAPLWSLPYEVQMYLVLPLFYFWGKRIQHPSVLGASGLLVYAVDWMVSRRFGNPMLFPYAPFFTLGIAIYFAKAREKFSGAAYCIFVGIIVTMAAFRNSTADHYLLALLFALGFRWFGEITNQWLCAAAHYIAKYSYGIYLSHIPIMWLVTEPMAATPLVVRVAVFAILSVGVPVFLYHSLEKPAIDFGARLASRLCYQPARWNAQPTRALPGTQPSETTQAFR